VINVTSPARHRVCVVILNWNQPELTARCLDHVLAQEGVSLEPLVIDNGSTAQNLSRLEQGVADRCKVLRLPRNFGFAGGMNRGIDYALAGGFEFVWLLNNDAFPAPDCLAALLRELDADPSLCAVTPLLTYPDGKHQTLGAELDFTTGRQTLLGEADLRKTNRPGVCLIGAALLVRASTLRRVGGFDERFFAYREDDDLCFRITRDTGGYLGPVPAARCVHLGGASTGVGHTPFASHLCTRNGWYLMRRYAPPCPWGVALLRYLATIIRDAGHAGSQRDLAAAKLTGLWAGVLRRYGKPAVVRRHGPLASVILWQPWRIAAAASRVADLLDRADRSRRPA
jgi:GT2 family glycosyltransferase